MSCICITISQIIKRDYFSISPLGVAMGYRWSTCINEDHSVATSRMLSCTIEFEYKICMVGINLTWDLDREMFFWQIPWIRLFHPAVNALLLGDFWFKS